MSLKRDVCWLSGSVCYSSCLVALISTATMESMNKRSERQRETKRGTEREREKCPNSLRPNDQQWLYNLSTHAHIQRHVYLGTRTPFHSSGQDYDEIERHTHTHSLWCRPYMCMHWVEKLQHAVFSLSFPGCFPPCRLHKWRGMLWRFYLTAVAWRQRRQRCVESQRSNHADLRRETQQSVINRDRTCWKRHSHL